ncbi:MAG: SulP family inorganic anion transporter [Planctomycetia bacterium]|nr:SulP family inorganic anion transporter [Planctomycetia bacterium]
MHKEVPVSSSNASLPTFANSWKADLTSGFLVFLIALPLCLGIAAASKFPPIAGVMTAVVGGIIATLFSNSELTIKGPAAGMIAIVAGAMLDPAWLGEAAGPTDTRVYQFVLAVGVVSGVIQILLGLFRAGILTEFFPMAPVHGLLASIGLIIISKQSYLMFGISAPKDPPLESLLQIGGAVAHNADRNATIIGLLSLAILFSYPWLKKKISPLKYLPAQLMVLIIAIPLGQAFHLGPEKLVSLPAKLQEAIVLPNFSHLLTPVSLKWLILFCLVGSLESLLSAKAIDILDPWKRKTNMNRDLLGVGMANTLSAAIGGMPMISEILRSSANIGNGGRTRLANLFHGIFLFVAIVALGSVVRMIPMAALGAMLVFAGFRLASPKEFVHMWHIGKEQFFVFVLTVACIFPHGELLLVGVGMVAELLINLVNGAPLRSLFKPSVAVSNSGTGATLEAHDALTFANWIPLKRRTEQLGDVPNVTLDLSDVRLVDHTTMDKLLQTQREFANSGRKLEIIGLEHHRTFGHTPSSGRKRSAV